MKSKPSPQVFIHTPHNPPKGWKEHYGMFCWVGDELYIPAFAAGLSNMQALVLTGYEWGGHVLMVKNVLLVKERWLWKEFPKYRKTYKLIRKTAIKAMIPTH